MQNSTEQLMIFPLDFQTISIAQMLSVGEQENKAENTKKTKDIGRNTVQSYY